MQLYVCRELTYDPLSLFSFDIFVLLFDFFISSLCFCSILFSFPFHFAHFHELFFYSIFFFFSFHFVFWNETKWKPPGHKYTAQVPLNLLKDSDWSNIMPKNSNNYRATTEKTTTEISYLPTTIWKAKYFERSAVYISLLKVCKSLYIHFAIKPWNQTLVLQIILLNKFESHFITSVLENSEQFQSKLRKIN